MYVRKTVDEYEVQGNYGNGYEYLIAENSYKEALKRIEEYQKNELYATFRIIKKRVPIKKGDA